MSLEFSEIIGAIESEIEMQYLPGAIQWADETRDGAWSKAMNSFDEALSIAMARKDYLLAQTEGQFYRKTVLELIRSFKQHKEMDDAQSFLNAIAAT